MSGSSTTQVNNADPWEGAQPALHAGLGAIQGLYNADPTGQNRVADRSPLSLQADQGLSSVIQDGTALSGTNAARDAMMGVLGGQGLDPIFQNIQSRVAPAVNSQFAGAGRVGSGLHQDTMTRAMTEAFAPQASQNMFQAANALPSLDAGAMSGYGMLDAIGNREQAYNQQLLDAPFNQAQMLLGSGVQAGGLGGSQSSTSGQNPGGLQTIGTGIGMLGALGSLGLFSDRRLKTDIKRVGKTDGGQAIYTYRYGGAGPFHMGVMADESPESAVGERMGFKTVNYEVIE